jgi:hypothetical protein
MPGETYFLIVAGLGVVLGGFAGLVAVSSARPWSGAVASSWTIDEAVRSAFQLGLLGLAVVGTYSIVDDVEATVRLISLAAVVMLAYSVAVLGRPTSLGGDRYRRQIIAITAFILVFASVNIGLASVGYLQFLMLILLARPALFFIQSLPAMVPAETGPAGDEPAAEATAGSVDAAGSVDPG